MKKIASVLLGATMLMTVGGAALAKGKLIAVSWMVFQEERWKTDEATIKGVIEAAGDKYISADAQQSASKQLADIEGFISQHADVIIIVPFDADAILPAVEKATAEGIPLMSYDVQIEDPRALYVTFDNVGVGRLMAKEILKAMPQGNYAFIKGDKANPNSHFLFQGIMEVLKPEIDAGRIKNVCETFTDGWKPDNAQKNMEQCLTSTDNHVDAVVSENDGMAGGVVAALAAQGLAGSVPVSGQDGDKAALNRVALGTQTVSVWKDTRQLGKVAGEAAVMIAAGVPFDKIPNVAIFDKGAKGIPVKSILLPPTPITKDNLDLAIKGGQTTKEEACAGVPAGAVAACN
jgi:D-xylose transport system substrate-binding protein